MADILNFYLDDSGTRHPDHKPPLSSASGRDWFALGGVLVREEEEAEARALHQAFCETWRVRDPLHSYEIRQHSRRFAWLEHIQPAGRDRFLEQLAAFLVNAPVTGLACVVDRPGYNHRYREQYGRDRWLLCKTAFAVVVERAAKFADEKGCRLRVLPERSCKPDERTLKGYYDCLKSEGMPFATTTSGKYAPLAAPDFRRILYDFKYKSSPMAQIADLYLYPMCRGGYPGTYEPYERLRSENKLIDCLLPPADLPTRGIKYSCFDLVGKGDDEPAP